MALDNNKPSIRTGMVKRSKQPQPAPAPVSGHKYRSAAKQQPGARSAVGRRPQEIVPPDVGLAAEPTQGTASHARRWEHFRPERVRQLIEATRRSLSLLATDLPTDEATRECLGRAAWTRLEQERLERPEEGWRAATHYFSDIFHPGARSEHDEAGSPVTAKNGTAAPTLPMARQSAGRDQAANWTIKIVRGSEDGKREELELGNYAKWLCVMLVAAEFPTIYEDKAPDPHARGFQQRKLAPDEDSTSKMSGLPSRLRQLFDDPSRGSVETFARGDDEDLQELLHWFNLLKVRQMRPLTADDILERRVLLGHRPETAVDRFRQWLINGTSPPELSHDDKAMPPEPTGALRNPALATLISDVRDRLQAGLSSSPVVNVVCMEADACREIVAEVCASLIEEEVDAVESRRKPTVLYFNVRGDRDHILALPSVLAALARVLGLAYSEDLLRASQRIFREALLEVRRACTVYPVIVVLDGVDEVEGPHAALLNVMRGSRWDELVRVLVQPDWSWAQEFGLEHVNSVRFLITSNVSVSGLEGWVDPSSPSLRYSHHDPKRAHVRAVPTWRRALDHLLGSLTANKPPAARIVMLAFVAASPDGISYGALWRAFGYWMDVLKRERRDSIKAVGDGPVQHLPQWSELEPEWRAMADMSTTGRLHALQELFGDEIVQVHDEPLPWVARGRTRYEWQSSPAHWDPPREHGESQSNYKLRFKTEALRTEFLRCVLTSWDANLQLQGVKCPPQGWPEGVELGDRLYERINMAIAIESLAHATSQLRSPESRENASLMGSRRLIQTIYHLRAAADIDVPLDDDADYSAFLSIPKLKEKRFRYAYAFLFKRCLEGGEEYRLARAHGRSDLKMVLLALFLVKDVRKLEPWWHGTAYELSDFKAALDEGIKSWEIDPGFRGRELVPDILHNLALAAVDAGHSDIARWALGKFEEVDKHFAEASRALRLTQSPLVNAALLSPASTSIAAWEAGMGGAFAKLRFDHLDASGNAGQAMRHARDWLNRFRLFADYWGRLEGIVNDFFDLSERANENPVISLDDKGLSSVRAYSIRSLVDPSRLGGLVEDMLKARGNERKQLVMSDLLSRYADVLATLADQIDRAAEDSRKQRLKKLLEAFAHFFVADRLRSGVAGKSGLGTAWASVPAKPTRIYTRTCLSIARCLVELNDPPQVLTSALDGRSLVAASGVNEKAPSCSRALYRCAKEWAQHGSFLSNVYVRHLSGHRREALQAQLLMTALVRTWVVLAERGAKYEERWSEPGASSAQKMQASPVLPRLTDAVTYLRDADRVLNDMGAPTVSARRVWTERLTLLIGLAKQLNEEAFIEASHLNAPPKPIRSSQADSSSSSHQSPAARRAVHKSNIERVVSRLKTVSKLIDMELLRAQRLVAGAEFWTPLVDRQMRRWSRLQPKLTSLRLLDQAP